MSSAEDERARVAERLRDGVADRLAALAARLDAVLVRASDEQVRRVIGRAAAELGELSAGVRALIVELQRGDADPDGVAGRVRTLALAAGQALGCTPRVTLAGPLDELGELGELDESAPGLAGDVVRVVEEALANVVRHSYAGTLELAVTVGAGTVTVEVGDDGVGPNDEPTAGTGLADLRARAERRGGELTVEPNRPLGTRLRWSVPT